MPQSPKLSSRGLTIALATTVILTLGSLNLYTWKIDKAKEKPLPVTVELGTFAIPTTDGKAAVLAPAIRLRNRSDAPIPHLNVVVNRQFDLYPESPLEASGELILPLEQFRSKASKSFHPKAMTVRKISVYGQLPSQARGVLDYIPGETIP